MVLAEGDNPSVLKGAVQRLCNQNPKLVAGVPPVRRWPGELFV
jgi:hypothetical protein